MPIIAAVYLFCYFSKNHICSRLILSFLAKFFLDIQWGSVQAGNNWDVPYNITFSNNVFVVAAWDFAAGSSTTMQFVGTNFQQSNKNTFHLYTSNTGNIGLGYLAIGN